MKSIVRNRLFIILAAIFVLFQPAIAYAETYNAGMSIYCYFTAGMNLTAFTDYYSWPVSDSTYASVTVVNNDFDSNCVTTVEWNNGAGTLEGESTFNSDGTYTSYAPAGCNNVSVLATCSDSTTPSPQPWSYVTQITDNEGNIADFEEPSAPAGSGSGGGSSGGSGDGAEIYSELGTVEGTLTQLDQDVDNNFSTVEGQLTGIEGTLTNQFSTVEGQLTGIGGTLTNINGQVTNMNGTLNGISSTVTNINGTLNGISSTLGGLSSYLTTPTTSQPYTVTPPASITPPAVTNFNSTPPNETEPYQTPYTYNQTAPTMPAPIDSPGPLPVNPDPQIPTQYNGVTVTTAGTPATALTPDTQLAVTSTQPDTALSPDTKLQATSTHQDTALNPDTGLSPDAPLTPAAPITPSSPIAAQ